MASFTNSELAMAARDTAALWGAQAVAWRVEGDVLVVDCIEDGEEFYTEIPLSEL